MNFKIGDTVTRKNASKDRPAKIVDITDDYYIINYLSQSDYALTAKPRKEFEKKYTLVEEVEYKRWRAEEGQSYYYVSDFGFSEEAMETLGKMAVGECRYELGNYFETADEAQRHVYMLVATQAVKDDARGFVPEDGDVVMYTVCYDRAEGILKTMCLDTCYVPMGVMFGSEKEAEDSIKKHEKEWKIVLGVKD